MAIVKKKLHFTTANILKIDKTTNQVSTIKIELLGKLSMTSLQNKLKEMSTDEVVYVEPEDLKHVQFTYQMTADDFIEVADRVNDFGEKI